jgi:Ca2+-binding EF-hand superfamily protein
MARKFERVDVDSDGFLTYEEILAFKSGHKHKKGKKKAAKILARLDADRDGVISAEEARNHWLGHKFESVDGNSDGFITIEELREFKKVWKHQKAK